MQVADRLVSTVSGHSVSPRDPQSNKSILFLATNGIAAISYAGLAYIGDLPTDVWLAEQLIGSPVRKHPDGTPFGLRVGPPVKPWLDIGLALKRISAALADAASNPRNADLRQHSVYVVASGWLWYRRKLPRPILSRIAWSPPLVNEIESVNRSRALQFVVAPTPDGYLSDSEVKGLGERLRHRGLLEDAVADLVNQIRVVAARESAVGADCMAISISPPILGAMHVLVQYLPATPSLAMLQSDVTSASVPVSFTPWILAPTMFMAPQIMTAGTRSGCSLGPYTVDIRGPAASPEDLPPGLIVLSQTQRRPPKH